jgi:DNA-binding SARP family transcriptional activator
VTARVRLLGRPRIEGDGRLYPPRGQKSWAVLARVALSQRPVGRATLAGELFADADDPMGALRWCLADVRRCLGQRELFRGDPLTLAADALWLDVWELRDGELPVADIGGVLLEDVEPRHCPRFDTWLLLARGECAARSMAELRQAALRLLATGEAEAALVPAGRAAGLDPLDEDAQELFLRTLVSAGHAARAAVHLALCEAAFVREGLPPSPAMRAAARPLVQAPRTGWAPPWWPPRCCAPAPRRSTPDRSTRGSRRYAEPPRRRSAQATPRCLRTRSARWEARWCMRYVASTARAP